MRRNWIRVPARYRTWALLAFGIFVAAPTALILGFILDRQASQAARRGNLIQSGLDLQTIGQAMRFYADGHQGEYPDSFQTLVLCGNITADYLASPARPEIPARGPTSRAVTDQLDAGGHLSYVYLGRGVSTKTVAADTILAFEFPIADGDGTNVLYGDGHVEFVSGPLVETIVNPVASGRFPVTIPSR